MTPLGLPVVPDVYISVQGIVGGDVDVRLAVAARGEQILVGAVTGRGAFRAEVDVVAPPGSAARRGLSSIRPMQLVLHDEGARLAVLRR